MANPAPGDRRGILESLNAFAATLVAIVHTRIDLLSTELQEAQHRLLLQLAAALLALFCLGIGVLLAALLVVVLFWDTHRVLTLGLLTAFFLIGSVTIWQLARRAARRQPRPFAATLAELAKDRQHLRRAP